jgi:hypothetical protein
MFSIQREKDSKSIDLCWPLIHYSTSPTSTQLRLLPFFWSLKSVKWDFLLVLPIYWSFLFQKDKGINQRYILLIPIFFHKRSEHSSLSWGSAFLVLPPYFFRLRKPAGTATSLWPLYGSIKRFETSPIEITNYMYSRNDTNKDPNIKPLPIMSEVLSRFCIISHVQDVGHSKSFFFPLFWIRKEGQNYCLCLFWLVAPYLTLFKREFGQQKILKIADPPLHNPDPNLIVENAEEIQQQFDPHDTFQYDIKVCEYHQNVTIILCRKPLYSFFFLYFTTALV